MLISFSIYLVCNAKILDVHEIISRWNSLNTLFSSWQNATTNILVTIIIMDFVFKILEIHWALPAQVRILPTADQKGNFLFTFQ